MKQSRFSEEQTIVILKEHEAGGKTVDLHGMSPATLYKWKFQAPDVYVFWRRRTPS